MFEDKRTNNTGQAALPSAERPGSGSVSAGVERAVYEHYSGLDPSSAKENLDELRYPARSTTASVADEVLSSASEAVSDVARVVSRSDFSVADAAGQFFLGMGRSIKSFVDFATRDPQSLATAAIAVGAVIGASMIVPGLTGAATLGYFGYKGFQAFNQVRNAQSGDQAEAAFGELGEAAPPLRLKLLSKLPVLSRVPAYLSKLTNRSVKTAITTGGVVNEVSELDK